MARPIRTPAWRTAVLAASLLAPGYAAGQSEADTRPAHAVIVLDGSNSMNARLPGDNAFKHVIVREGLRQALPKVTAGTQLGLAAFGHRRPSDCTDVEVMQPPTAEHERIMTALERYQPKGFSPVVQTLRAAAKALPQGSSGKASLIVVLDDLASCRSEDPCKVAADLKRDNPALNIHVVGLALKPVDQQVMACVAKQTDGRLFEVQDAAAVGPAIAQALQLASAAPAAGRIAPSAAGQVLAKAASPVGAAANKAAAPAVPRPAESLPPLRPGVHLTAHLAGNRPALGQSVQWRVLREADSVPVAEATQPQLSIELPNGRYIAEVHAGLVVVRQAFAVGSPAATPIAVPLNAAMLSLSAPLQKGGAPSQRTLISVGPPGAGERPLWLSRTGADDLVVPAGTYRIVAEDGLVRAEETVTVAAGGRKEVELPLGGGRLVVDASLGNSEPLADQVQFVIEEDDPDSPTGKREIMRSAAARLETTLPAGSYQVTARRGAAEVRERVAVKAGEETSRTIQLAVARVRLSSRTGIAALAGAPVNFRIERLDANPRVITRGGEAEPVIELSPGRYRFEARIGAQNAMAALEIELRGGTETRVELNTGAGGIRLRLPANLGGLGFGEVFWQVRNEAGQTVWRTSLLEPVLVLAPGRYTAVVETRDKLLERTFDVRAGDNRTVDVGG